MESGAGFGNASLPEGGLLTTEGIPVVLDVAVDDDDISMDEGDTVGRAWELANVFCIG
jgi:hypothetical protein